MTLEERVASLETIFDSLKQYYQSMYSGEEIDDRLSSISNAVRYDASQSLSTAQQAQARSNINAAPGGYGLGDYKMLTASDDIDTIYAQSGFYHWESDIPANAPFPYGNMVVFGYTQILAQPTTGTIMTRTYGGGKWLPLEYVNPPMTLGVEYRTTEQYLGKPVYVKAVNFGAGPNAATKTVDHGVTSIDKAIRVWGNVDNYNLIGYPGIVMVNVGITEIGIKSNEDMTARDIVVCMAYTKTTD